MFIILLFIFILIYRVFKEKEKEKGTLIKLLLFSFLVNILFLLWFNLESNIMGYSGVIGSDDIIYFKDASALLERPQMLKRTFQSFSGGYTVFIYLILITSFIKTTYIVSLVNILIFLNIQYLIFNLLKKFEFKRKNINYILFFLSINGFIIFTNIRILKDVLLFYIVLEMYYQFLKNNNKKYLIICLLGLLLNRIRPYSSYLMFFLIFLQSKILKTNEIDLKKQEKQMCIYTFVFLAIFFLFFKESIYSTIKAANLTALRDASSFESETVLKYIDAPLYKKIIVGFIRFIMLPIPIKIFMTEGLKFYKTLAIIGSCFWWFILWKVIIKITFFKHRKKFKNIYIIFLFSTAMILVYIILYLGNAEARLRYPMYISGTIIALGSKINSKVVGKKQRLANILLSIFIFICINYIQYKRG